MDIDCYLALSGDIEKLDRSDLIQVADDIGVVFHNDEVGDYSTDKILKMCRKRIKQIKKHCNESEV